MGTIRMTPLEMDELRREKLIDFRNDGYEDPLASFLADAYVRDRQETLRKQSYAKAAKAAENRNENHGHLNNVVKGDFKKKKKLSKKKARFARHV